MPNRQRGQDVPAALTDSEAQQVCQWLGEFRPPQQIPKLIKEHFRKSVSHNFAYQFQIRRKWGLLIDRYRQEWLTKIYDIPLANKKYRLGKLQHALERLEGQETTPDRYERRLLALLTSARLEMEEQPDHTTFFFTNINQLGDEELLQRRAELLKRIQNFRWPKRGPADGMGDNIKAIEASGDKGEACRGGEEVLRDPSSHGAVGGETPEG